jgi:hypothetical protein
MDKVPPEILSRIFALLEHGDISRLMRTGSYQLYAVGGMRLYGSLQLKLTARTSLYLLSNKLQAHGRDMLEFLSRDTPHRPLGHPIQWLRHLSIAWPAFPSEEDERIAKLLLRVLTLSNSLLSLELRGRQLPAWERHIQEYGRKPQFLPHLLALKTDAVQDAIHLASGRRLESLFINITALTSFDLERLINVTRCSISCLQQLQLSLETDSIARIVSMVERITTAFPKLSVLCLEFDLGRNSPERPLSWTNMKVSVPKHCRRAAL